MDIYIVLYEGRVVGASARLQGAELIATDEARRLALNGRDEAELDTFLEARDVRDHQDDIYARMTIHNTELKDLDE